MQSKFTRILAMIAVMILMLANVLPVVSYASQELFTDALENQGDYTDLSDVKFDVSFENGKHVNSANLGEEGSLNISLEVIGGGYLEEITIDFTDANFELIEEERDGILEILDNTVAINRVASKEKLEVSVRFKAKEYKDAVKEKELFKESTAKMKGKYMTIDGKVDVKGSKAIRQIWESEAEVELNQEVTKYIPIIKDGKNKVLVQERIKAKLVNNSYPVKESTIAVKIPRVAENLPEEIVVTGTTEATNGDEAGTYFSNDNYLLNAHNEEIVITVENNLLEDNMLSWKKDKADEFLITYIYGETVFEEIKETGTSVKLQANAQITLNNIDEKLIEKEITENKELTGNIGMIVNVSESMVYPISKGYMLNNLIAGTDQRNETIFAVRYVAEISYASIIDKIVIDTNRDNFLAGDVEVDAENYTYNKSIVFSKEEFLKIFGEEGRITLSYNEEVLGFIDRTVEANEEGNYIIDLSSFDLNELTIETSNPITEGQLIFTINKAIKKSDVFTKEIIDRLTGMKSSAFVKVTNGEDLIAEGNLEARTELTAPETKAAIYGDRRELSTLSVNKDVNFKVVLYRNSQNCTLYKNPTVQVVFPFTFDKIENIRVSLEDEDELVISGSSYDELEDDRKVITLNMQGSQTKYNYVSGGTVIDIVADVTMREMIPTETETVQLLYFNENDGLTRVATGEAYVVSPAELMMENKIESSDGTLIAPRVDEENEEQLLTLISNVNPGQMHNTKTILNNLNRDITNVKILGRIGKENTNAIENGESFENNLNDENSFISNMNVIIDTTEERAQNASYDVYYSENGTATDDLENPENGWTLTPVNANTIKSYLVVTNNYTMGQTDRIRVEYDYNIPTYLEAGVLSQDQYSVSYSELGAERIEEVNSEIVGFATQGVPKLNTRIELFTDENYKNHVGGNLNSGTIIYGKVTIENVGATDVGNVDLRVVVPEGFQYIETSSKTTDKNGKEVSGVNVEPSLGVMKVKTDRNGIPSNKLNEYENKNGVYTISEYMLKYTKLMNGQNRNEGFYIKAKTKKEIKFQLMTVFLEKATDNTFYSFISQSNDLQYAKSNDINIKVNASDVKVSGQLEYTDITKGLVRDGQYKFDIGVTNQSGSKNVNIEMIIPEEIEILGVQTRKKSDTGNQTNDGYRNIKYNYNNRRLSFTLENVDGSGREVRIPVKIKLTEEKTETNGGTYQLFTDQTRTVRISTNGKTINYIMPPFRIEHSTIDFNLVKLSQQQQTTILPNREVFYEFNVINNGDKAVENIEFRDILPKLNGNGEDLVAFKKIEISVMKRNNDSVVTPLREETKTENGNPYIKFSLLPGEYAHIKVVFKTKHINIDNKLTVVDLVNYATISYDGKERKKIGPINHKLETSVNKKKNYGEHDEKDTSKNYRDITGVVWEDSKEDGIMQDEPLLRNVVVILVEEDDVKKIEGSGDKITDKELEEIAAINPTTYEKYITKTNRFGEYIFSGVDPIDREKSVNGQEVYKKYYVFFIYDSGKYSATEINNAALPSVRSTATELSERYTYKGKKRVVAVTPIQFEKAKGNTNLNLYNINLGLKKNLRHDLAIDMKIEKIAYVTDKAIKVTTYNSDMALVPIRREDDDGKREVTLYIQYKIRVTNEGRKQATKVKLKDIIPEKLENVTNLEELKELSEFKIRIEDAEGKIEEATWNDNMEIEITNIEARHDLDENEHYKQADIDTGNYKDIYFVLKTKDYVQTKDYGLDQAINNRAYIMEGTFEGLGKQVEDIDSKYNNETTTEDDYSDARVYIQPEAGQFRFEYLGITLLVLIIIGTGIIFIKKNILDKEVK